jgi:adenosine deaminase
MAFLVTDVIDRDCELWRNVHALPKVELHRHLEGSLRLETLYEVGLQMGVEAPLGSLEELAAHVQMTRQDPQDLMVFLEKFGILRRFYLDEYMLRRTVRESIEDAAADNIRYLELRFTPNSWARGKDFSVGEVVRWACEEAQTASKANRIKVGLIVSINRHEGVEAGRASLQAALDYRPAVVGLDLAGKEPGFPTRPFMQLFREAKRMGLGITVHAGEWEGPANVRDAIETVKADRIGHGARIVEDSATAQLAREQGIYFEVCPTSNIQTGVVGMLEHHPFIDMRYLDLPITINTDDPSIHQIVLTDEYVLAMEVWKLNLRDLHQLIVTAARAAFLPQDEKDELILSLKRELGTSKYRGLEVISQVPLATRAVFLKDLGLPE